MSLKEIIRKAELATIEIAAGGDEWWASRTKQQQKDYIEKHPNSKYAKNAKSSSAKPKADSGKASGPKLRGPKAFVKPTEKKTDIKPVAKKKSDKKPSDFEKKTGLDKFYKKTAKDKVDTKRAKARSKKTAMSTKEKLKHALLRIKNLTERLTVLDAEKAYRNAARAFTKRDTTKERLTDRIKKIGEIKSTINGRIKSYQKRVKELQSSN